jgi:hypothetical protein
MINHQRLASTCLHGISRITIWTVKKLGLTPLKAIASLSKRKNTSRVGGYLCDGTKSRSVSDPNGIPLNGIALFGFGIFLVEPTTQPLFQAPAGRKLAALPTSGDYLNLVGTFARPIRWNPVEQHWISLIHLIGRASRSREQVSGSISTFILLKSLGCLSFCRRKTMMLGFQESPGKKSCDRFLPRK